MAAGEKIAAHVAKGRWYELSTLRRYVEISLELMKDAGNTISVGTACTIDNEADVRDAILWDRVKIDAGARVKRAVLADGVTITSGETIQNAVVVPAALVSGKVPPQKALRGHVVGENFVVPLTL
jgi:NDP-sugar pyrophosphorylase family protein